MEIVERPNVRLTGAQLAAYMAEVPDNAISQWQGNRAMPIDLPDADDLARLPCGTMLSQSFDCEYGDAHESRYRKLTADVWCEVYRWTYS